MNIGSIQHTAPVAPADLSGPPALTADQRSLIQAVKAINASQSPDEDHEMTYSVDRAARTVVVKLVNKKTGDVVEQIPAEYVLRLAEKLNGG